MKNKSIIFYALIFVFLSVAIIFFSNSQTAFSEFLIFLFCGILVGINIYKLKNLKENNNGK